jgi:peptidoglycan hydrolase CwlO-like protein
MEIIKIAGLWAVLLLGFGLGVLMLAVIWQMFFGKEDNALSFKCAARKWFEYNERYDKLSELKKTNTELQKQVDDLKRELEEVKRKLEG